MNEEKCNKVKEATDRLYEIITVERAFKEGEKLPSEFKLAASLNIGRSTLREAIAYLKEKGIVESRKGSGTYVTNSLPVVETTNDSTKINVKLRDIMELRLVNEPAAIVMAINRASSKELDDIIAQGEYVMELIESSSNRMIEEQKFHEMILRATKNELFINMIPLVSLSIQQLIESKHSIGRMAVESDMDYSILLDALRLKDRFIAKNAMEIYFHHIIDSFDFNKGKYPLY